MHDDIEVNSSRWQKHDPSTTNQSEEAAEWYPISICRHVPTMGIPHIDLFLAPQSTFEDEERILRTWRLMKNPRELEIGERIDATPLQAHRGVYARLEKPVRPKSVSGVVTPLARGMARIRKESGTNLILEVRWEDDPQAEYLVTADIFERVG
ncbi:MAG: hypothetical protein CMJ53_00265 [Planctomycetaceae bacterium]|nr:hypothetical protein [Planctomycetaceae bacterium]